MYFLPLHLPVRARAVLAAGLLVTATTALVACTGSTNSGTGTGSGAGSTTAAVTITGGHETNPVDHGRPVVLVASLLGVPEEVFRQAFSGVTPAGAGAEPDDAQVRRNRAALLAVLAPYGVTNDELDAASNAYRYNQSAGEVWAQRPASAVATVGDGKVTAIEVTDGGAGYTSAPTIEVAGTTVTATAHLRFTTDVATNGSLASISVG